MKLKPPMWLPYLGPVLAAGVGGGVGYWLEIGFWPTLAVALICGFAPIVAYRLWKRLHHRQ